MAFLTRKELAAGLLAGSMTVLAMICVFVNIPPRFQVELLPYRVGLLTLAGIWFGSMTLASCSGKNSSKLLRVLLVGVTTGTLIALFLTFYYLRPIFGWPHFE